MNNNEINNYFFIDKEKYDGHIDITIVSKSKTHLEKIMDNITFELKNDYELYGFPIQDNNNEKYRRIYFKKITPQSN